MNLRFLLSVVALASASTLAAQESLYKKEPYRAVAHFAEGSLVNITIMQPELKIQTDFGLLTIPFERIKKIEFGLHYPDGEENKIAESINALGSNAYREREHATKYLLSSRPFAYPLLKRAAEKGGDPEFIRRATALVGKFEERFSAALLCPQEEDAVHTDKFRAVGKIQGRTFKAHSQNFGNLDIKFSDLKRIGGNCGAEKEFQVDASKYGSSPDQWLDTGVDITENIHLTVKAQGQVDIWPNGPGQYLTTPKGYTTAGKGSPYMAGALVGKIGKKEKTFLIGEKYEGVPADEGRLLVQIVPSPWNNASTGSYYVRITTVCALLR